MFVYLLWLRTLLRSTESNCNEYMLSSGIVTKLFIIVSQGLFVADSEDFISPLLKLYLLNADAWTHAI